MQIRDLEELTQRAQASTRKKPNQMQKNVKLARPLLENII